MVQSKGVSIFCIDKVFIGVMPDRIYSIYTYIFEIFFPIWHQRDLCGKQPGTDHKANNENTAVSLCLVERPSVAHEQNPANTTGLISKQQEGMNPNSAYQFPI